MAAPVTAILGLGRDVGDAVARRFMENGHRVIAADPSAERLKRAEDSIPEGALFHHGELHTRLGLRNCFATGAEGFGRMDNVVVIPDVDAHDTLQDITSDKLDKALARTVRGAALVLREFSKRVASQEDIPGSGPERLRQKGTVTFVLSYSAHASMPGRFSETVTQSGLLGVVRAGALELAEETIRVNAIVAIRPRAEKTDPWTTSRTPLGRTALADEIADAASFLASPEAAIITGETLVLDGGRSALAGILR